MQRLNWQNLLVQPPPDENVRVGAMDWHPQEKVLSVGNFVPSKNYKVPTKSHKFFLILGYSNGTVIQIDVENQCECNTLQLESEVACLAWTRNRKPFLDESKESEDIRLVIENTEFTLHFINSNFFLAWRCTRNLFTIIT